MSDNLNNNESKNNCDVCPCKFHLAKPKCKKFWFIIVPLILSIGAIITLMFFGFFFSPSDTFSVIAIGICAILLITPIICTTIIISKYIGAKAPSEECCKFSKIYFLLEAYKVIFENSKK